MKPFIKWVGGKTKLLPILKNKLPKTINHYIEPFLGGGALFLNIGSDLIEEAILSDVNFKLIHTWKTVEEYPDKLIETLKKYENAFNNLDNIEQKSEFYYKIREDFNNSTIYDADYAAKFIFINKTCFNGLYREGSKHNINVPFGYKTEISLIPKDIYNISHILNNKATILCSDFEQTCSCVNLNEDDFVFFDSPYINQYTGYNTGGFTDDDHIRLLNTFKSLSNKNVKCMMTNNNCDLVKDMYKDFSITEVEVTHSVGRRGDTRKGSEVIITNY